MIDCEAITVATVAKPRANERATEHVAAEIIGAQPVSRARGLEAGKDAHLVVGVGGDRRSKRREEKNRGGDGEPNEERRGKGAASGEALPCRRRAIHSESWD